ncbi:LacI family DNA-binding transcriptional regulator [Paenibacillus sp. CF384]|uniref:LacI family DNA-binding transcriptional regulator n=1 Tax=Paenibacillus sp. CF384 TaxID=1884382 RepID=UPI000899FA9B|nr:LacI family DNA-binding transcriptional regulator [Paenibacillus sp. CF384]SDW90194.1 LacI family transcriptional regulator [Paenibacillus sp. CF384]
MAQKISMQQLADRLGVSKYTVSQALAGKPGVSEATRREVTALAGALGYKMRPVPPGPADEVRGARIVHIGLDEHHAKEPHFWQRVREGLAAGCRMHGLTPKFFTFGMAGNRTAQDWLEPERESEHAAASTVSGFIIAGKCPLDTLLKLKRLGLPIVLADHEEPLIGADAVLNANADAGRMACHHLLTQGCKSIVFVGRDSFAVSFRERWWGCKLAMDESREGRRGGEREKTVAQLKKWTVPYGSAQWSSWQTALIRRLDAMYDDVTAVAKDGPYQPDELPDGYICANDDIALYLLQLLHQKGVMTKVRVIGIDNTAPGMDAVIPLTTVDLAKEWLGIRAVEQFARKLALSEAQQEKIILSARLVVRNSG